MNKAVILLIVSVLITGANGIIASNTSESSSHVVFLRTAIASVGLLLFFLVTGHRFTFYKNIHDFIMVAVSGLSMGVSWLFLYEAYLEIGVSLATLLFYIGPIIVMVLSPFLFKETHTLPKLIGFAIVLIGVLLVNGIAVSSGVAPFGIFIGAMSAVFYSCVMIFSKKVTVMRDLENPLFQFIFSFLAVAVYVGFTGGYGFVFSVSEHDWILLVILALVNTCFASTLYFTSVPRVKAQSLAVICYVELLSAVVYSAIFLGESLAPLQILGAVCIIGGALFAELYHRKRKDEPAASNS